MQIEVIKVDKTTKATTKSSYILLEVAYKQLSGQYAGKLASKKLMSFVQPDAAYKALSESKPGEIYEIEAKKNEGTGYVDWLDAHPQAPGTATGTATPASVGKAYTSTYETPEERAKKQVYIIRQSCLAQSVAFLTNIKGEVSPNDNIITVEEVLGLAQQFTEWVLSSPAAPDSVDEDVPY